MVVHGLERLPKSGAAQEQGTLVGVRYGVRIHVRGGSNRARPHDSARCVDRTGAEEVRTLQTNPGIGPVLAASIMAEFGDVRRFPDLGALVAYAGLDPSVIASGQFKACHQGLSKGGSPYLRRVLFMATYGAQYYRPDLRAYLQRKIAQGKPHKAALVATTHKLLARFTSCCNSARSR